MTGSTAARRRISRRMGLVRRLNLAVDPDAEILFVIVAAITLVDMDAAGLNAGLLLQLGDDRPQRVAVERIAMQGFGVQHKLAAFGLGRRGGDRYLAAELVRRPRFAFADALHLRGVQRIDLGAALPVILEAYPHRQSEKVGEALLEPVVAGDLAANVADHPAQPDAQEFECSPRPLELVGMGI